MSIKKLSGFFIISILLLGCTPKPENTKLVIVKSVDTKYSLTMPEGVYQNKWNERVAIAKQYLPGTPVDYISILYASEDKKSIIYGLTMPTVPIKAEELVKETEKAFKAMPNVQSYKVELLPTKNEYERFKIDVMNNFNHVTTEERCMVGNGKNYIIVCANTQKDSQEQIKAIMGSLEYH